MLVFENGNAAEHEKQQPMSKASVLAVEGLNKSRRTKEAHAIEHENAFCQHINKTSIVKSELATQPNMRSTRKTSATQHGSASFDSTSKTSSLAAEGLKK